MATSLARSQLLETGVLNSGCSSVVFVALHPGVSEFFRSVPCWNRRFVELGRVLAQYPHQDA